MRATECDYTHILLDAIPLDVSSPARGGRRNGVKNAQRLWTRPRVQGFPSNLLLLAGGLGGSGWI